MSDRDDRLEQMLQELRPRTPSAGLRERIADELNRAGSGSPVVTYWYQRPWVQAAAALIVLLAGLLVYLSTSHEDTTGPALAEADPPPPALPVPAERPQYQPVSVKRYLVGRDDMGVVRQPRANPARKVIYRTMERSDWHDPVRDRRCTIWKPEAHAVVVGMDTI